jgi:iron complex transport system permease protein
MTNYKTWRLFKQRLSFLVDKHAIRVISILFIVTIGLFIFSTGRGEMNIAPFEVVKALFGHGTDMNELVVKSFRLPRIIVAFLAGACLAASGAILQGVIRNPLASPDIIGVTGGASVAVVLFLAVFSDENNALTVPIHWMPLAAFIGAVVAAFLVYTLSWKNGISPIRLVLIGIGISALAQSITTLLMILGPIFRASQANIWLTGTVYGSNWEHVKILTPIAVLLFIITFFMVRHLNVQELGDEVATSVGSAVQKRRFELIFLSAGLTGCAVAFAGGIGFVGLMAPHMARRLTGSAFGTLLPVASLLGGCLVMAADLIGRTMFLPFDVPAGVFTAAIGAPYFIYLLYRSKNV